jgi:hypothetical protein
LQHANRICCHAVCRRVCVCVCFAPFS